MDVFLDISNTGDVSLLISMRYAMMMDSVGTDVLVC